MPLKKRKTNTSNYVKALELILSSKNTRKQKVSIDQITFFDFFGEIIKVGTDDYYFYGNNISNLIQLKTETLTPVVVLENDTYKVLTPICSTLNICKLHFSDKQKNEKAGDLKINCIVIKGEKLKEILENNNINLEYLLTYLFINEILESNFYNNKNVSSFLTKNENVLKEFVKTVDIEFKKFFRLLPFHYNTYRNNRLKDESESESKPKIESESISESETKFNPELKPISKSVSKPEPKNISESFGDKEDTKILCENEYSLVDGNNTFTVSFKDTNATINYNGRVIGPFNCNQTDTLGSNYPYRYVNFGELTGKFYLINNKFNECKVLFKVQGNYFILNLNLNAGEYKLYEVEPKNVDEKENYCNFIEDEEKITACAHNVLVIKVGRLGNKCINIKQNLKKIGLNLL